MDRYVAVAFITDDISDGIIIASEVAERLQRPALKRPLDSTAHAHTMSVGLAVTAKPST